MANQDGQQLHFQQVDSLIPNNESTDNASLPAAPQPAQDPVVEVERRRQRLWKKKARKLEAELQSLRAKGVELYNENYRAVARLQVISVENERLLDLLSEVNDLPEAEPAARQPMTQEEAEAFDIMLSAELDSA